MCALFYLGRDPHAECVGVLYGGDRSPVGLAVLPVGRRLLTATCRMDYRIAARDLFTTWTVGGFGRAYTPDQADFAEYTLCPPCDGRLYRLGRTTLRDWAGTAYAYDPADGRVWGGTTTAGTPHHAHPDPPRGGRPSGAPTPAPARCAAT